MTRDDDRRAADLDRYWDALVAGQAPAAAADRELAALIDQLHGSASLPTLFPNPEASWHEIRPATTGVHTGSPLAGNGMPAAIGPNGRIAARSERRAGPRVARGWAAMQAVAAVLLVVVLAAGYLLFWVARQNRPENQTWVPAEVAATLPEGFAEEMLFRATFAADERPVGLTDGILYRLTMPPGTSLSILTGMGCICPEGAADAGIGLEIVESGSYAVRPDAPIWIQRGGVSSPLREVPAREEVILGPGDIAIYHDYVAAADIRTMGDDPAVVTGFAILDLGTRLPHGDSGHLLGLPPEVEGEVLANAIPDDWREFPPGPITATLRRVTLPPDAMLPPFPPASLEGVHIESGGIGWGFVREGETQPRGPLMVRRAGYNSPFTYAPPGVKRFLKTTGDEPAVLLVLTIEPAGFWAGLLGP
jgi:hypothetical protein